MNIEHGPDYEHWSQKKLIRHLQENQALIRELVEALHFYAKSSIYRPHPQGPAFERRDLSDVGKAALAKAKAVGYEV